jgi:hypothetical protein
MRYDNALIAVPVIMRSEVCQIFDLPQLSCQGTEIRLSAFNDTYEDFPTDFSNNGLEHHPGELRPDRSFIATGLWNRPGRQSAHAGTDRSRHSNSQPDSEHIADTDDQPYTFGDSNTTTHPDASPNLHPLGYDSTADPRRA